jgi:hypothetical protein
MDGEDEFTYLAEQATAFADSDEVARLVEQIDAYRTDTQLECLANEIAPFIAAARLVAARAQAEGKAAPKRAAIESVRQHLPSLLQGAGNLTAGGQQQGSADQTGTGSSASGRHVQGSATIIGTGSLALGGIRFSGKAHVADPAEAEAATAVARQLRRQGLAGLTPNELHNVILAWLIALVIVVKMAADAKTAGQPVIDSILTNAAAWGALALAITWRILDKHR